MKSASPISANIRNRPAMTRPLTEDQRAFQETAERFTREKIAPFYMAREKDGRVDRALVRDMGALGLIGADLPER
jgi:cyclohexanecarboxyl-CoA dehydrogenase